MNKKDLILPILAIGLVLAFVSVSAAVILSRGKSKKWIARKMKIGALLLTLSAVSCNGGGEVTCYDTAETNAMWINPNTQAGIEINPDTGNMVNGHITTIHGEDFSFCIADSAGKKWQTGSIQVDSLKAYSSTFKIALDTGLKAGKYLLKLYDAKAGSQDTLEPKREFNLVIKNE
jgi:hypothetical protein